MALNTYTHENVEVTEEENAHGKPTKFLKCRDCGVRITLKNVGKFKRIDCDAYRRGT